MNEELLNLVRDMMDEEYEFTLESDYENTVVTIPIVKGTLTLRKDGTWDYISD